MSEYRPSLNPGQYSDVADVAVRNRVLRNTYWLLAISLIPTVLGAAFGMYSGINKVMATSPFITMIIFLAGAFFAAFFADLAGAFLAAFFAAVFFGTDPPVSLKISKFTYFGTRKAQRLERCVHKHQLRRARIPHDSLTRRRRGHHLGACEKSRIHI